MADDRYHGVVLLIGPIQHPLHQSFQAEHLVSNWLVFLLDDRLPKNVKIYCDLLLGKHIHRWKAVEWSVAFGTLWYQLFERAGKAQEYPCGFRRVSPALSFHPRQSLGLVFKKAP